jgi:hypothetical protein
MIVVLKNAVHSDGRRGDAYLGGSGCEGFSTDVRSEAHQFACQYQAEDFAQAQRDRYRGFAGDVEIRVEA